MSADRIILAGGSGFLGRAIAPQLRAAGYRVVVLTRGAEKQSDGTLFVHWDAKTPGPWVDQLEGAAAIVNLAGKSVNCRYTPENRSEIVESRIDSVRAIGDTIARCKDPPRLWIQAASAAIYGDAGEEFCDENTAPGDGFSPETCVKWETAFAEWRTPSTRRVLLRIAFALGTGGGALDTLAKLTRLFLGGAIGSGRQWMSWVHFHDLGRLVLWAIRREQTEGLYLVASPNPVRNAEFMRELRGVLHRPWSPPVPVWAVKIGSWLMGTESELALRGHRCIPRRLLEQGFEFSFPELRPALNDLFTPAQSSVRPMPPIQIRVRE